jgi:hypothetical protein
MLNLIKYWICWNDHVIFLVWIMLVDINKRLILECFKFYRKLTKVPQLRNPPPLQEALIPFTECNTGKSRWGAGGWVPSILSDLVCFFYFLSAGDWTLGFLWGTWLCSRLFCPRRRPHVNQCVFGKTWLTVAVVSSLKVFLATWSVGGGGCIGSVSLIHLYEVEW